ncbi:ATP-binding cassette domain-containing protein [Microbacterium sp.]|uniref:ATP-binding cassette domain-containing protein n=1 Tax=Microbacterium sp. TaxID=51671 RepID=UPI003A94B69B
MTAQTATSTGFTVSGLTVHGPDGVIVAPLDLSVPAGRMVAIIGESGSGKSMTARAITGLLPRGVTGEGAADVAGYTYDLAQRGEGAWSRVRGRRAALLLQDPFTSLSPLYQCGEQICWTLQARAQAAGTARIGAKTLRAEVARRLDEVHLSARVAGQYPFELSGGMRQRVAIAAALAASPQLLIADEPTTALDASTQGEVLDLLRELQLAHHMSLILISHDLGVVGGRADDVIVMRRGEVVERGSAEQVLRHPSHEYTRALIDANPALADPIGPLTGGETALLTATDITKSFGGTVAVRGASVDVAAGEVVAIVGESGSGKSTLARCIAGLERPDEGRVELDGAVLSSSRRGRTPGQMQIVFQDPYSTLNPAFTVGAALAEAVRASGTRTDITARVDELLTLVGLDPALRARRPAQLSGGQRQRVAIARALAPEPRVLICDESVSALDVSVQAQILSLLDHLRETLNLAMLFITHDLSVVARIANRVVVLREGTIVERGTTAHVLTTPDHAYTRLLLAAARRDSMAQAGSVADEPGESI